MGSLDLVLFLVFGAVSILSLTASVLCFRRALRVANQKDGDLKMFLWASGTMFTLVIAGMSAAYILIPLLLYYNK